MERHAQPGKVLEHFPLKLRRATGLVNVLHPYQKPATERDSRPRIQERRQRVPEMQVPVGRRSKAEHGLGHEIGKAVDVGRDDG
ncbi:hypothetical protein LAB1_40080 [Roseibium sp. LAB1]